MHERREEINNAFFSDIVILAKDKRVHFRGFWAREKSKNASI
jgi:hypothetical protein